MVSEGQKCRRGADKLFKAQSLEQQGDKANFILFFYFLIFASLAVLEMGKIVLDQGGMKLQ